MPDEFFYAAGPVSLLRVGRLWALVGRLRQIGIGARAWFQVLR